MVLKSREKRGKERWVCDCQAVVMLCRTRQEQSITLASEKVRLNQPLGYCQT